MLSKQLIVSHIYFKSLAAIDFSKCWSPVSIVVMQSKLLFTSGPFLLLKNCQFVLCYICTCYRRVDVPSILLWVVKTSPLMVINGDWFLTLFPLEGEWGLPPHNYWNHHPWPSHSLHEQFKASIQYWLEALRIWRKIIKWPKTSPSLYLTCQKRPFIKKQKNKMQISCGFPA